MKKKLIVISFKRVAYDDSLFMCCVFHCRGERRRPQFDENDDVSPHLRTSDPVEDQIKEGRVSSYGEIDAVEEQVFTSK